jgi:hypothetical protein
VLVAQATQDLGTSSGLLLFLLGGGLIGLVISAYRFFVNLRTTERGLARQRAKDAKEDRRVAQWEAGLWQARSADLEFVIRRELGPERIPPLSADLRKLIDQDAAETGGPPAVDWNIVPHTAKNPGEGPGA